MRLEELYTRRGLIGQFLAVLLLGACIFAAQYLPRLIFGFFGIEVEVGSAWGIPFIIPVIFTVYDNRWFIRIVDKINSLFPPEKKGGVMAEQNLLDRIIEEALANFHENVSQAILSDENVTPWDKASEVVRAADKAANKIVDHYISDYAYGTIGLLEAIVYDLSVKPRNVLDNPNIGNPPATEDWESFLLQLTAEVVAEELLARHPELWPVDENMRIVILKRENLE